MTTGTRESSKFMSAEAAREITGSIYLSRREASLYLGTSEKFLATHLVDGPRRIRIASNRTRYRLSDLETWMSQREVR
jgi:predicted DNA-binding transcriptional regulator AlpA